jgi:hypothetical protein
MIGTQVAGSIAFAWFPLTDEGSTRPPLTVAIDRVDTGAVFSNAIHNFIVTSNANLV